MPHTHSAKKRMRQTSKRRAHNRAAKKIIKGQIKKLSEILAKGPSEQSQAEFRLAIKKLDKAASKRILHPDTAARKKSQLARLMNAGAAKS